MPLSVGDKLGPYEILSPLGEGGMGKVWKARDTRLDRTVALKEAKAEFSERFEREARAVAALNHPNICTLHDVGPNYLVMELVEGTALKGPLPVARTLEYAEQILDALDAVHRKGITHRDLKPANILVTKSGCVKLLDFGLAKIEKVVAADQATASMGLTMKGEVLGTVLYMSPEQLQGLDADARSDIFSFGLVLYEMLTGRHAMEGATRASVIAAILERPAPSVAGLAPAALDRILKRCLAKDPDERWQTVRDLKFALDSIAGPSSDGNTARPVMPRSRWLWLAAGVFVLAAAVFAAARFSAPTPTPVQRLKLVVETPRDESLLLTLSPDGSRFAFATPAGLRVRALDSLDSQLIPGTSSNPSYPTWSPDGRYLAYWTDPALKKVSVAGGTPQTLVSGPPYFRGMAWNNDGTILFSTGILLRVSENGGTPTAVTAGENRIQPTPLPDGRHFLYLARSGGKPAIYAASLDSTVVHQVTEANSQAEFVPPNQLLFLRGTTLMAQPFDLAQLRTTGPAVPVAEDIGINTVSSHASFSTARNGMITYQTGGVGRNTLTWVDRAGKPTKVVDEEHRYLDIALSPDGKQIATARVDPKTLSTGVWVTDVGRGIATRITSEGESAQQPAWSPDGKRIAYVANGIRTKSADGTGTEELQVEQEGSMPQWAPDSRTLVFADQRRQGLSLVSTAGDHRQARYRDGRSTQPAFSPDGRWMAYTSQQGERWEVFVESVPAGHGKWQISEHGGAQPVWRQDGRELFYRSDDNKIMVAPVRTGSSFEAGASKELFLLETFGLNQARRMYAVSSDGQRFLVHRRSEYHPPVILLQNWLRPGK